MAKKLTLTVGNNCIIISLGEIKPKSILAKPKLVSKKSVKDSNSSTEDESCKYQVFVKNMKTNEEFCYPYDDEPPFEVPAVPDKKSSTKYGVRVVEDNKTFYPPKPNDSEPPYQDIIVPMDEKIRQEGIMALLKQYEFGKNCVKLEENEDKPEDYNVTENGVLHITTQEKSVATEESSNMRVMKNASIHPGALVFVDKDLLNGNPNYVDFGNYSDKDNYGKVNLDVSYAIKGLPTDTIPNSNVDIDSFVDNEIIANSSGCKPSPFSDSHKKEYSSVTELKVAANVSASFCGVNIAVSSNVDTCAELSYKLNEVTQSCFTISARYSGGVVSLFGKNITPEILEKIYKDNGSKPIALIESVDYGRYAFEITEYKSNLLNTDNTIKAGYTNKINIEASVKTRSNVHDESISFQHDGFGGDMTPALLESYWTKTGGDDLKWPSVDSQHQPKPISFKVRLLSKNQVLNIKNTGVYYENVLEMVPVGLKVNVHNRSMVKKGSLTKVHFRANVIKFEQEEIPDSNHDKRESIKKKIVNYLVKKAQNVINKDPRFANSISTGITIARSPIKKASPNKQPTFTTNRDAAQEAILNKALEIDYTKKLKDMEYIKELLKDSKIKALLTEEEQELILQEEVKSYRYKKVNVKDKNGKNKQIVDCMVFGWKSDIKKIQASTHSEGVITLEKDEYFDPENVELWITYRHPKSGKKDEYKTTKVYKTSMKVFGNVGIVNLLVKGDTRYNNTFKEPYFDNDPKSLPDKDACQTEGGLCVVK